MKLKPIRNVEELQTAKAALARLVAANQLGANDDDVEVLSLLIQKFEREHVRIDPPDPIAAIEFRMREMGLTPRDLLPFIGSRARVSEVLGRKRYLSIDMIRSLHDGLEIPYESLISSRERKSEAADLSDAVNEAPNELSARFPFDETPAFVHNLSAYSNPVVLHRRSRSQRTSLKTDQGALGMWRSQVLKAAAFQSPHVRFRRSNLSNEAIRRLAILSASTSGPLKVIGELRGKGICVILLPSLPGTYLDGAAMLDPDGRPVIGLTLRHDRVDGFWFTLAHELAHVHLHYDILHSEKSAFMDDMEIRSDDKCEQEADALARVSLIPDSALANVRWDKFSTGDDITAVASRARVHIAVVAGRWQRDHQNYRKFSRLIERGTLAPMLCSSSEPSE